MTDLDYTLPERLIAQLPPTVRDASRLLVVGADAFSDCTITDLPDQLQAGDLLVFNDTRVLKARLFGQKASGGQVEVLVERVLDSHQVLAHVRASKSPKVGSRLLLADRWEAEMVERQGELFRLRFTADAAVLDILEASGKLPLPPYITRDAAQHDDSRYQTVYAKHQGAVAAPTAGLHFTDELLAQLKAKGVHMAEVTLHVGAGTFQPVRVDNIAEHTMPRAWYEVPPAVVAARTCNRSFSATTRAISRWRTTAISSIRRCCVFTSRTREACSRRPRTAKSWRT